MLLLIKHQRSRITSDTSACISSWLKALHDGYDSPLVRWNCMHVRWNCMHVIRFKFAEGSNAYRGSCAWSSPLLTCSHGIVAENDPMRPMPLCLLAP